MCEFLQIVCIKRPSCLILWSLFLSLSPFFLDLIPVSIFFLPASIFCFFSLQVNHFFYFLLPCSKVFYKPAKNKWDNIGNNVEVYSENSLSVSIEHTVNKHDKFQGLERNGSAERNSAVSIF